MAEQDTAVQQPMVPATQPIQIALREGEDQNVREQQIVQDLVKKFEAWETWRKPYENLWAEAYAAFMSVLRGQKVATRAKVFVPIAFQVIEAALPKLVNIIFGQVPFFEVEPENAEDEVEQEACKAIQKVLQKQLQLANFFLKFIDFAKQLLMYGTSYFYVYWKVKREWAYEKTYRKEERSFLGIPLPPRTVADKRLVYKVTERRPEVEVLDIGDVYPDPEARTEDPDSCSGVFVASSIPLADIEEGGRGRFATYANTKKLSDEKPSHEGAKVRLDRRSIRGTGAYVPTQVGDNMVEVLTFWGKYDLDGDGIREECMIVIANRTTLIKAQRNPFEHQQRPVLRSVLFPVPMEWYGVGLLEPIIPLIYELNTLRNQGLDVNNLIINRMWKVDALADVEMDTLISVPNGVVLCSPITAVEALNQESLPNSVYQDSATIQRDIENTTAPRSVQGVPESGQLGRTARGAQLIIGQALEKFGMAASLMEDSAIRRVLWHCHRLNRQFLDNDQVIAEFYGSLFSENTLPPPDVFLLDPKFKLLGLGETITKEAKINQIISFLTIFKDVPGLNLIEIAKIVWTLMDTGENAEKAIQQGPFIGGSQIPEDVMQAIRNQVQTNGAAGGVAVPSAVSK